ncbi:hypothetical protein HYS48_01980 [Candidatus Woesearchaeota archaeon]|nr:hypothetical protein [Candidatus Woesearchaeota archaeon]
MPKPLLEGPLAAKIWEEMRHLYNDGMHQQELALLYWVNSNYIHHRIAFARRKGEFVLSPQKDLHASLAHLVLDYNTGDEGLVMKLDAFVLPKIVKQLRAEVEILDEETACYARFVGEILEEDYKELFGIREIEERYGNMEILVQLIQPSLRLYQQRNRQRIQLEDITEEKGKEVLNYFRERVETFLRGSYAAEKGYMLTHLKESIHNMLKTLTPREIDVLSARFQIGNHRGQEQWTLEELGKRYSVERERIRQIEAKALRKLRSPKWSEYLKAILRGELWVPPKPLELAYPEARNILVTPIEKVWGLSARCEHYLPPAGIRTVADLALQENAALLKIKNLGRKSLQNIKETLALFGLRTGMTVKELEEWERSHGK